MNFDPVHERLRRLERKVEYQTWVLYLQTGLLAVVVVLHILRLSGYLLLLLVLLVPLLILFRRMLPWWSRRWTHLGSPGLRTNEIHEPRT